MSHTIAIAYRIYPGISKTPAFFSDNKMKMAEVCFASFIQALEGLEYHIWVLFDNCPNEYEAMCLRHCKAESMTFLHYKGIGNALTFEQQILILEQQNFSDNIMFAEDDYFYLRDSIRLSLECLCGMKDAHFVTPYDHPNYYTLPLHQHKSEYRQMGNQIWKTVNATCLTFLTTKNQLEYVKSIFLTYKKKNYDASMWLAITQKGLWSSSFLFAAFKDSMHKRILVKLYLFSLLHIVFKPSRKLWAAQPSLNTHFEKNDLAKDIDWKYHVEYLAHSIGIDE
ncbi:MAG TPA: glycosyltransferase family 2 protein [Candidatus Kapabacteria bacterium]|nr:glycosyltransferase family 2 protein [Candidatus Kapabacteria bacterium]